MLQFDVIILTLCISSLFIHLFGIRVMVHIYKHRRKTGQKIYLINFSIFETTKALVEITMLSIAEFSAKNPSETAIAIQHHLSIISETMMAFLYYAAMFHITIERLATVILGLKYCSHDSVFRAKVTLIITWSIGITIGTTFCLLYKMNNFYYVPYNHYVYLALDILFMVIAASTYITLFGEHRKSFHNTMKNVEDGDIPSVMEIYQRSKFYIPVLLMTSFLMFMVIPDLIYVLIFSLDFHFSSVSKITHLSSMKSHIWHCMVVLNVLSDVTNAFIYLFADSTNRRILIKLIRRTKGSLRRQYNVLHKGHPLKRKRKTSAETRV